MISYVTLLASSSAQIEMIISTNIHAMKKNNFQFINERDATIGTFDKILLKSDICRYKYYVELIQREHVLVINISDIILQPNATLLRFLLDFNNDNSFPIFISFLFTFSPFYI